MALYFYLGSMVVFNERDFFSGNLDASLQTLTRAKDLRSRLLKRVQVEQPDIVMDQKQLTAKVTVCMCVCPV